MTKKRMQKPFWIFFKMGRMVIVHKTFRFGTADEARAFLRGVMAGAGYLDASVTSSNVPDFDKIR